MADGGKGKGMGIDLVFGGPPKGKPMPDEHDADHEEARDTLLGALSDAGIEGEKAETLTDALHEYIMSCISYSAPSKGAAEDYES